MEKLLKSIGIFSFFVLCLITLKFFGIILGACVIGSFGYMCYSVRKFLKERNNV